MSHHSAKLQMCKILNVSLNSNFCPITVGLFDDFSFIHLRTFSSPMPFFQFCISLVYSILLMCWIFFFFILLPLPSLSALPSDNPFLFSSLLWLLMLPLFSLSVLLSSSISYHASLGCGVACCLLNSYQSVSPLSCGCECWTWSYAGREGSVRRNGWGLGSRGQYCKL